MLSIPLAQEIINRFLNHCRAAGAGSSCFDDYVVLGGHVVNNITIRLYPGGADDRAGRPRDINRATPSFTDITTVSTVAAATAIANTGRIIGRKTNVCQRNTARCQTTYT